MGGTGGKANETAHRSVRWEALRGGGRRQVRNSYGLQAHLKEVRLVFAHESDENAVIMAKVEPRPRSDTAANGSRRSSLDAGITIPRARPSGVYRLARIGYETARGRLGHLFEGEGFPEASLLTFEVDPRTGRRAQRARGHVLGRLTRAAAGTSENTLLRGWLDKPGSDLLAPCADVG